MICAVVWSPRDATWRLKNITMWKKKNMNPLPAYLLFFLSMCAVKDFQLNSRAPASAHMMEHAPHELIYGLVLCDLYIVYVEEQAHILPSPDHIYHPFRLLLYTIYTLYREQLACAANKLGARRAKNPNGRMGFIHEEYNKREVRIGKTIYCYSHWGWGWRWLCASSRYDSECLARYVSECVMFSDSWIIRWNSSGFSLCGRVFRVKSACHATRRPISRWTDE